MRAGCSWPLVLLGSKCVDVRAFLGNARANACWQSPSDTVFPGLGGAVAAGPLPATIPAPKESAMRHLVLAAAVIAIAALVSCGGGARSADAPAAGKGGTPAPATQPAKPTAQPATTAKSEPTPAAPAAAQPTEAATAKAINTICPVTGLAVDPSIPPVEVTIDIVSPPMVVLIGVNNAEAAKRVAADPERFAAAARNNREARSPTNPAAGAGQR